MTKIFLTFILIASGGNHNLNIEETKLTLLTGNSNKSWYYYMPDLNSSEQKIFADNTYTFFSDGSFEFDHGSVIEEAGCKKDCPGDLVNFEGKWEFTNNETGLRITALHEKGNAANAHTMVLYDATIVSLTETSLVLDQKDPETKISYRIEFRKK